MPRQTRRRAGPRAGVPQRVRIIGGRWRGRRLAFPDRPGLRPTPDRVRETLFNWLAPVIAGARCLDLFAGSGALGLEAASRGAAQVTLVEQDPALARNLREQVRALGDEAAGVQVVAAAAHAFLAGTPAAFDVVFLDPPFGDDLLGPTVAAVLERGWLAPDGWLYVEASRAAAWEPPAGLSVHRAGTAGQVAFRLFRRFG